ncbi:uncharacterized protein LOC105195291 [Solenopsis invicta]|uniref:uncharacterized protein LOC105195291 n=1 Tax=Solenopsis invicta TaxID=13686 RepID=UPI00193D75A9|nr:uncharacterized protein LOC105195291 [Solenopsis invicta]
MEKSIHVQVEDNSLSIEHILRPISYTSWLLGVGVARPRKCPKTITIIIRIVHLVVCTLYVVYSIRDFFIYGSIFALDSDIFEFIGVTNRVTLNASMYYNIYHGIRQYDKWPELMDRIKELDQKIRRETPMNDRPVKNLEALAILTTLAWCPLALIIHVLYYFINSEDIYVTDVLFYYVTAQSLINSFVFDVVVYVLYCRFKTANKLIRQLNKPNELNESLSDPSWIVLRIRRIRELYMGICHLVSMVNDIHGVHLLFCSATCFVMVVTILITIYMGVVEKNYSYTLINNISWITYATQFGLMCCVCTLTRQESDKIGGSMYECVLNGKLMNLDEISGARNESSLGVRLQLEDSGSEQNCNWSSSGHNLNYAVLENLLRKNLNRNCIRNEINDFSIQLQQYRVSFTACDFFEMSNAFLGGFFGMIITYLVIFIQFYQQPDTDKNVVERLMNIF